MLITVTQLNNFLKGMIDCESMLSSLSVQGEVCNYRLSYDSVYFSLKDGTSQIDCFSFLSEKNTFAQVNLDGMQIIARGRINFLQKTGKLSFFINQIESTDKLGESYLRLLALKKKLEKEGCFARELKKTINKAQTIGVVSSAKGAVIADIFQVATRRNPSANIILYPVKVQGLGADTEICEGIDYFSNSSDVDVVIVARGGGSAEDLSVFNSESIVRALNRCCKPTVSAVGHEVDFTLCDLAADARGATPSEAAELVTNDIYKLQDEAISLLNKMLTHLSITAKLLSHEFYSEIQMIVNLVEGEINQNDNRVRTLCDNMRINTLKKLSVIENKFTINMSKLSASNPIEKLRNGYAIITNEAGKRIDNIDDIAINDNINITLSNGKLKAKVYEKETSK